MLTIGVTNHLKTMIRSKVQDPIKANKIADGSLLIHNGINRTKMLQEWVRWIDELPTLFEEGAMKNY